VTRRRSFYRSLTSLQRDNHVCRACAEAGFPLESKPVFEGHIGQVAYLYGQAPGAIEGAERRPWRGLGEDEFYATFYCASVTRCYPGKSPSGRGDRAPAPQEQELCAFWRRQELRLLEPRLLVTVGGLAARRLLGVTALTGAIGHRFELAGVPAVPLPHPSGASGWLNDLANRKRLAAAVGLVQGELSRLA
jgi:uracil-DNA glycosylase